MSNYVYIRSEAELWTVGFYDPSGKWHPDSDYDDHKEAAKRVHYLNGGNEAQLSVMNQRADLSEEYRRFQERWGT